MMHNIFQNINALPGVKGVLASIGEAGMVSPGLENELSPLALNQFKIFLDEQKKLYSSSDGRDLEIRFNEAVILVRDINDDGTLAVICAPDINLALLNVTIDMLQRELKTAATQYSPSASKDLPPSDIHNNQPPANPTDLALSGPLQNIVMDIQQALLETIGPFARTIMSDSVKSWAKVGATSTDRLQELIDLLCMEIGDSNLESKFRQAASIIITGQNNSPATVNKSSAPQKKPKILVNKKMAQKLADIMTDYTNIMGPVGSLIMKDCLQKWAAAGEASPTRIPALLKMLGKEIADQKSREEFTSLHQ